MNARKVKIDLDQMKIASPCKAIWNEMAGDERSRHCRACKLNVYNVAGLTKNEAEALLEKAAQGQRVCMRLSRRADGTIITKDCPVGLKLARRLKLKATALRFSLMTAFFWFTGTAHAARGGEFMGKIAAPAEDQPAMMGEPMPLPVPLPQMGDVSEPNPEDKTQEQLQYPYTPEEYYGE